MKRGAFESVSLGQTENSAKVSSIQLESVARGMVAFGQGLGAVSDMFKNLAEMADKAYSARISNLKSATKSLENLIDAKANLSMVKEVYEGVNTPESRLAILNAENALKKARESSDQAIDAYARTGILYKQLGIPNVKSGEKRRIEAEKRVVERIKNGEDEKDVGGILGNVEHQSFFGAVLENW